MINVTDMEIFFAAVRLLAKEFIVHYITGKIRCIVLQLQEVKLYSFIRNQRIAGFV